MTFCKILGLFIVGSLAMGISISWASGSQGSIYSAIDGGTITTDSDNANFGVPANINPGGSVEGLIVSASSDNTIISTGGGTLISAYGAAGDGSSSPTSSLLISNAGNSLSDGLSLSGGLNNNSGGITNAGSIAGATSINASGTITGGTLTDGTASITGGNISGVGTLGATTVNDTTTNSTTFNAGVNDMTSGNINVYSASKTGTTFSVAGATGNTVVGGTLGVTGNTTLTGSLTANGGATIWGTSASTGAEALVSGNSASLTSGNGSDSLVVSNTGTAVTGALSSTGNATIATGAGTTNTFGSGLNSSSTIGATGSGSTELVGGTSNLTLSTAGGVAISGNTAVTGTESVSGNFSANGAANNIGTTQNSTNNIGTFGTSSTTIGSTNSSAGNVTLQATGSNSVVVGQTQTDSIAGNSFSYGTTVNGGMLVNGSLGVNGNIYTLNPTANANVNVGNNGLSITGSTNAVLLTSEGSSSSDGISQLSLNQTNSSLMVTNIDTGVEHGISIGQDSTVISGGTHSTSLTLDDNGATFNNDVTNGPVQVHGVADGTAPYDAVNVEQLNGIANRAYAGTASAIAMANLPPPVPGKSYSIGAAYGNYSDQDAFALGFKTVVGKAKNITLSVDYAYADTVSSVGAGVGYSF